MFKIQDGRKYFYQWDLDRKLIVEDGSINQVHFCNRTDECSLVCEVYDEDGIRLVDVPNVLLQDIWRINVYGYDMNYTKHNKWFDVYPRTKPTDYVYTETETLNYNTLLNRIDEIDESIEETVDRWLQENPPEVDLSAYATVDYVDEAVSNVDIPDVDLSDYYTKEEVDGLIPKDIDLSEYLTESEAEGIYARITDIPDVSDFIKDIPSEYITESELNAKGYATTAQIPDVSNFATKSDIPDVSNYQTAEQVNTLISDALAEIGVAEQGAY